ncbi:MAG: 23S rRNA (pseudouridine(1915)-N(3))-methyltransferase RlmH [Alphaproteobacteria bacterium]|nr:23S rRNA (pseudouridine(1915)-N(3))-methyltransferase RlmH [Alphaproteobacteria bacterium]
MRLLVAAVGRARRDPAAELFAFYSRRIDARVLGRLELKEVEDKRPLAAAERRAREAELLLAAVPAGAVVVALDAAGKTMTSAEFADLLGRWRDRGTGLVAFLIGGAEGHGQGVLDRAELTLSLGPMTWPHLLVRGMLAEQLYRAQTILAGHPYHRS